MRNKETSAHLRTVAQMMALDGTNRFKISAFEFAAEAVENLKDPVEDVDFESIEGIGRSTAEVVREFLRDGDSSRARELRGRFPGVENALTMTIVDGIGAKTAYKLYKEKGIKDFDELAAAAEQGELREKLAVAVRFAKEKASGRIVHSVAKLIAQRVVDELGPLVDKIQVCGSIRRGRMTSKDVDIVACVPRGCDRAAIFGVFGKLGEVINAGDKKSSVWVTHRYLPSMQVDLWLVEEWYWGSALHYVTGSKEHVKSIRATAYKAGYTINEYGVFKGDSHCESSQLAGRTEESMYEFFGWGYPEPKDREGKIKDRE